MNRTCENVFQKDVPRPHTTRHVLRLISSVAGLHARSIVAESDRQNGVATERVLKKLVVTFGTQIVPSGMTQLRMLVVERAALKQMIQRIVF